MFRLTGPASRFQWLVQKRTVRLSKVTSNFPTTTVSASRHFTTTNKMPFPIPSMDPPKHEMAFFPNMTTSLPSESAEFRRVLWTGLYSQLVLMTVPVDGEIGDEVCQDYMRKGESWIQHIVLGSPSCLQLTRRLDRNTPSTKSLPSHPARAKQPSRVKTKMSRPATSSLYQLARNINSSTPGQHHSFCTPCTALPNISRRRCTRRNNRATRRKRTVLMCRRSGPGGAKRRMRNSGWWKQSEVDMLVV
jgi:hypothetical protein